MSKELFVLLGDEDDAVTAEALTAVCVYCDESIPPETIASTMFQVGVMRAGEQVTPRQLYLWLAVMFGSGTKKDFTLGVQELGQAAFGLYQDESRSIYTREKAAVARDLVHEMISQDVPEERLALFPGWGEGEAYPRLPSRKTEDPAEEEPFELFPVQLRQEEAPRGGEPSLEGIAEEVDLFPRTRQDTEGPGGGRLFPANPPPLRRMV